MENCAICLKQFEAEDAAVLTMTSYGHPLYLCEECEKDLDCATTSKNPEEISDAIDKIGKKIQAANNGNSLVLETVSSIIESATERGEMIKNGIYNFESEEDIVEEDEVKDEVPEELLETEEDKALDEKKNKSNEKFDKVINLITLVCFIAFLGYLVYWFITTFLMV